jgi:putative Mg2+ transporter-C (MgtC) family protein
MEELGISQPDWVYLAREAIRLYIAMFLGAALGLERESKGRPAGLRTHMLVALGAALFTAVPVNSSPNTDLAHIVKGIAAGVGFLGAGAILKKTDDEGDIRGITTAASIWLTAAIGFAVGAGRYGEAILATACAWTVLYVLQLVGTRFGFNDNPPRTSPSKRPSEDDAMESQKD